MPICTSLLCLLLLLVTGIRGLSGSSVREPVTCLNIALTPAPCTGARKGRRLMPKAHITHQQGSLLKSPWEMAPEGLWQASLWWLCRCAQDTVTTRYSPCPVPRAPWAGAHSPFHPSSTGPS